MENPADISSDILVLTVLFAISVLVAMVWFLLYRRHQRHGMDRLADQIQQIVTERGFNARIQDIKSKDFEPLVSACNALIDAINMRDHQLTSLRLAGEGQAKDRLKEILAEKAIIEKESHERSRFLSSMSHELRTPLHAIMSYAGFGIEEVGDASKEDITKYFERIKDAADRLSHLINDLLELAKLESGAQELQLKSEDFAKIVRLVVNEMQALAEKKSIQMSYTQADFDTKAWLDYDRMMQAFWHLLRHVLAHTKPGSEVKIALLQQQLSNGKEGLGVVVFDSGSTIQQADLPELFSRRYEGFKKSKGVDASGLGLIICHTTVTAHGGQVWAEICEGGGVSYAILLPATGADAKSASTKPQENLTSSELNVTEEILG